MTMPRVKDIRDQFIRLKDTSDARVGGTIELIGSSFLADEPTIFGEVNKDYVRRELKWYESQSLNVYDIMPPVPKTWRDVADRQGFINSNYGYLLYSKENGSQYANVRSELNTNRDGRKATAIYTRPTMHTDWFHNERSDFVCTNAVNYFIRGEELHAVVQMRSNDVVFGYRNDYAWQRHVLERLAHDTYCLPGPIIWQAASLHVYERHWNLIPGPEGHSTWVRRSDGTEYGQPPTCHSCGEPIRSDMTLIGGYVYHDFWVCLP